MSMATIFAFFLYLHGLVKTAFTQVQTHIKPDGSALGVFALLVLITIMPKEMGHLICVFLGAGIYLLYLILQPSLEQLPSAKIQAKNEPSLNKDVPAPQSDRVLPVRGQRSIATIACAPTSCMNSDAMKTPEQEAVHDDDGVNNEVSTTEDSSGETSTDEDSERSIPYSAIKADYTWQRVHTNGDPIEPKHDEQLPQQLQKQKEDLKQPHQKQVHFSNNQQQDTEMNSNKATEAATARTEFASVCANVEINDAIKNARSIQMPMPGVNWIENTNAMFHAEPPMIDSFCNQICGIFAAIPVCMTDNVFPTPVSTDMLNAQQSLDCWNWIERGWCPRGAACRWKHPREKEDSNIFFAKEQCNGDTNLDGSCNKYYNVDVGKSKVINVDNPNVNGVCTADADGYSTDDGF